jgi:tRNA A-37 threonylcarbamoyl transferase component Bud32
MFCCSCLTQSTVDSFATAPPHDATTSDNNPAQPLLQRSYTQPSDSSDNSSLVNNSRGPIKYPTLVLHGAKQEAKRGPLTNTVIVASEQSNSSTKSNHTVTLVSTNNTAGVFGALPANNLASPPLRVPRFRTLHSNSSSDSDLDDMADTTETVDKAVAERAAATKEVLEAKLRSRKADMAERKTRRIELNRMLADPAVDDETKRRLQAEFEVRERELLRESRKRMGPTDFEPLVVIGRGAFGEVKLVRHKEDGKIYAMKTMHKTMMILKNQSSHVRAERDALAAAENQWIVNLHFSFQDEDHLYLVMDFCAGGDLMTLLIKEDVLPEAWVKFYAAEAIQALASVHALGYIHRDIKPDNMLLDYRGHLKLTDLGLCKKVDDSIDIDIDSVHEVGEATAAAELRGGEEVPTHHDRPAGYVRDRKLAFSTVGTPDYIDYQVLLKKGYSYEADWWALGTVLYECMLGFPPFYGDDPVQTCRKILHYKTTLKFPADRIRKLSAEAVDFLKSLITDADARLGTKGTCISALYMCRCYHTY